MAQSWRGHHITKHLDTDTGHFYYRNHTTHETYWDKPAGVEIALTSQEPEENWESQDRKRAEDAAAKAERAALIDKRHAQHRLLAPKITPEEERAAAELARVAALWREAEGHAARKGGQFTLSWHKLGAIGESLWSYPDRYAGQQLQSLHLIGLGLTQLPADLAAPFRNLKNVLHLALPCNELTALPDALCELTALTHLNLMRNKLVTLPTRIGALSCLQVLELANNRLTTVPPSFGGLVLLKKIVLDCNRITQLPETLGTLQCRRLSLNFNRLSALPRCIKDMPRLRQLSASNNGLKALSYEIGDCPKLQSLTLCRNRLTQLPDALCKLVRLQTLKLDYNFMTGLPSDFHKLEGLKVLSLEGNPYMIYPSLEVLAAGLDSVRTWCKRRFADRIHARRNTIVLTVQDVLQQLAQSQQSDSPLVSLCFLEPNAIVTAVAGSAAPISSANLSSTEDVSKVLNDVFYAVVWDRFWSKMLPALERRWAEEPDESRGHVTSFAYAREEVETVLKDYRDPTGRVMRTQDCLFRRCGCTDAAGRRRVCIPPRVGYMCQRRATLIKKDIILERELLERQRIRHEERDVVFRIELARKLVKEYSESEEGQLYYQQLAISKAEDMMKQREAGQFKTQADALLAHRQATANIPFDKEKAAVTKQRDDRVKDLQSKIKALEAECNSGTLKGWALQQKEGQLASVVKQCANLPEDRALADIEIRRAAAHAAAETKVAGKISKKTEKIMLKKVTRNDQEFLELVAELLADSIATDMDREGEAARVTAIEDHTVLRRIMGMWVGLGMREVFTEWKTWTKRRIKLRRHDARAAVRQAWHDYEANSVAMNMAQWNKDKWVGSWDDYNDLPYWTHSATGQTRYEQPTVAEYLPENYEPPVPPEQKLEDLSDSDDGQSEYSDSDSSSGGSSSVYESSDAESDDSHSSSSSSGSISSSSSSSGSSRSSKRMITDGHESDSSETSSGSAQSRTEPLLQLTDGGAATNLVPVDTDVAAVTSIAAAGSNEITSSAAQPSVTELVAACEHGSDSDVNGQIVNYDDAAGAMLTYSQDSKQAEEGPTDLELVRERSAAAKQAEVKRSLAKARATRARYLEKEAFVREKRLEAKLQRARGYDVVELPADVGDAMDRVGFDREAEYTAGQLTEMAERAVDLMREGGADMRELNAFGNEGFKNARLKKNVKYTT